MAKLQQKEQAQETEQRTAPQEIPVGKELSREELGQIHETEAKETAQLPPGTEELGGKGRLAEGTETLPAATGGNLAALVDEINDNGEGWEGQDYIPTIFVDKDENEGAIVDTDGEVIVPAGESIIVSIVRSHQQCALYEKTYDEFQEIMKADPEAENKILCKSANCMKPDQDIEDPYCGKISDVNPCRKVWDKRQKRFVSACQYKDEGRCVEQTCLLVADYTALGEDVYTDKEVVGECIKNEDFERLFPSKELYWLTISGFGWTTYGDFRKELVKAIGKFNKLRLIPKVQTPGVLAFTLSATNKNKDSYNNKRWCFEYKDIVTIHEHMGDINMRVTEAVNNYYDLSEGDKDYQQGVKASMHWIELALEDVKEYREELKSGDQSKEG